MKKWWEREGGAKYGKAVNPSIETTSKKTSSGEIINPTKEDLLKYNKKYKTIRVGGRVGAKIREQFKKIKDWKK